MTYMNQIIKRTGPLTRSQAAVFAVLGNQWATVHDIWKRSPIYLVGRREQVRPVAYGTVCAVLRSLVQQGYAERIKDKRVKYRDAKAVEP